MHRQHHAGYRALRKGRQSLPGYTYLITTVTHGRRPLFGHPLAARRAAVVLASTDLWMPGQLLCWVLMPDHWHGLLALGEGQNLSVLVGKMKANVSRQVGDGSAPIWMSGFHDRALRADEDVKAAARYLVANPVRAGLVDNVLDYPFWDAVWMDAADDVVGFGW